MSRSRFLLFFLVAVSLAAMASCDLKKEINNAGKETEPFSQKLEDMPITGLTQEMPGICSPIPVTFDQLMSTQSWWADARDHLDSVEIDELDFRVKSNHSTSQVSIYLYLSDVTNVSQVSDADYLGATSNIAAGAKIEDWTPMELKPGAEKRISELVLEPDTEFTICARVPEVASGSIDPSAVNLKLGLQISGSATFVPIGD